MSPQVVIVGAGPAGVRAAETLVRAGLRPIVIDEASRSGGQIYRRPPPAIRRDPRALYGFEAKRACALHETFDSLQEKMDYRPETVVWSVTDSRLHVVCENSSQSINWQRLILATGAIDRVIPFPGWTLPGAYTLGGAQIALKAQACSIGGRVVFFGTGPLLYLVAYQYARAGANVLAVLDTAPSGARLKALPGLLRGGRTFIKGAYYVACLRAWGVRLASGIKPIAAIAGPEETVAGFTWRDRSGHEHHTECDAIGFGYGLKSETQLADLCGASFAFDAVQRQWVLVDDGNGRSVASGVYLAGDGALVRGADIAELAGERAACAVLVDLDRNEYRMRLDQINAALRRAGRFRRALDETAFPFPAWLAQQVPDDLMICRCEGVTAGALREVATCQGVTEINRAKALTRVGMGRCQGRICGPAASEILGQAAGIPIEMVGRLRAQPPVKPMPLAALAEAAGLR